MRKEAVLYEVIETKRLRCNLCAHRCVLSDGQFGICGVRQNIRGVLYTHVYGEAIAHHVDPIEKKPFYHFLPGSNAYSIATVGCNFKCGFCQNWNISQISKKDGAPGADTLMPEAVVEAAGEYHCRSVAYTYTEPTIFFEYAFETARRAKKAGLYNCFVTNGYMTSDALEMLRPCLDACNVDLKFFNDRSYKKVCGARLEPVLESIRVMKRLGIWVEITTLVIPGENDSTEELTGIAEFIAGVGKEIPWHISRFHPDYKFNKPAPTSLAIMERAKAIGVRAGLRYIYLGNVLESSDTICYNCSAILLQRGYFKTSKIAIKDGSCSRCGVVIDGIWS